MNTLNTSQSKLFKTIKTIPIELPVVTTDLKAYFSLNGTKIESISNTSSSTGNSVTYNTYGSRKGVVCGGGEYSATATNFIQNVNINNFALTATNGVSISVWIYPTNITTTNSIVLSFVNNNANWLGGGFLLLVRSNAINYTYANYTNGYAGFCEKTGLTISNNTWYHVVATFDGINKTGEIYINNIDQTTAENSFTNSGSNVSGLNITSTNILSIGTSNIKSASAGYQGVNFTNFTGVISKVGIYNKILTQAEVTSLYNAG